jgi:hypothetical protein
MQAGFHSFEPFVWRAALCVQTGAADSIFSPAGKESLFNAVLCQSGAFLRDEKFFSCFFFELCNKTARNFIILTEGVSIW